MTLLLLQVTEVSARWRRLVHQLELLTCRTGEVRVSMSRPPVQIIFCVRYGLGAVAMVTCAFNCKVLLSAAPGEREDT